MPTTTKMGIVYPSSTDLVKDGATNMGTIATTVDAKTGLVLLNTQTFSAVSSVSFPNNTFSSTFNCYRLVIDFTAGDAAFAWRGRAAGTDNSSSNYMWMSAFYNSNATPGTSFQGSGGLTTWGYIGFPKDASMISADLNGIFATQKAQMHTQISRSDSSTAIGYNFVSSGMSVTTSYDSLSLIITSGTMSGKASIYGYNL
jgi:hypothetical protein